MYSISLSFLVYFYFLKRGNAFLKFPSDSNTIKRKLISFFVFVCSNKTLFQSTTKNQFDKTIPKVLKIIKNILVLN